MNGTSEFSQGDSFWGNVDYSFENFGQAAIKVTDAQRHEILAKGRQLTEVVKSYNTETTAQLWLIITGQLGTYESRSTEDQVKDALLAALGSPGQDTHAHLTVNLLLDTPGGNLDSAFRTVLYISRYAHRFHVYIPHYAKSAGTLVAVGADVVYLSPFAELGPLDTQIPDPRNPATTISALDCYQSMHYVRSFGFDAFSVALERLVTETEGRVPLSDLLNSASTYSIGSITPMLQTVKALDFGAWGRRLRIGERYAHELLRAKNPDVKEVRRIAERLVYGYTHHRFPINDREAIDIGLPVRAMNDDMYPAAMAVIEACGGKQFVGLISPEGGRTDTQIRDKRKPRHTKQPTKNLGDRKIIGAHEPAAPQASLIPVSRDPDTNRDPGDANIPKVRFAFRLWDDTWSKPWRRRIH